MSGHYVVVLFLSVAMGVSACDAWELETVRRSDEVAALVPLDGCVSVEEGQASDVWVQAVDSDGNGVSGVEVTVLIVADQGLELTTLQSVETVHHAVAGVAVDGVAHASVERRAGDESSRGVVLFALSERATASARVLVPAPDEPCE